MAFTLICFVTTTAIAQEKKKGFSRINLSYATQYYSEERGLEFSGEQPYDFVKARNTVGHNLNLSYQFVTKFGLLVEIGGHYGVRNYDISLYKDLSNFDRSALNVLKGSVLTDDTKLPVRYIGARLMLGYRLRLKNNWAAVIKGGVASKLFYNGDWDHYVYSFKYFNNHGTEVYIDNLFEVQKELGRDPKGYRKSGLFGRHRFPNDLYTYELYAGVEKVLNYSVIKSVSAGVELCRSLWMQLPDEQLDMKVSIAHTIDSKSSYAVYNDRNLSIGLRLGVGLWK